MDALSRHWKRLKDNPSQLFLIGSVLVCAVLIWFVLAVKGYRKDRDDRALWSELADKRLDPGRVFYVSPGELAQIEMTARQAGARRKAEVEREGRLREQMGGGSGWREQARFEEARWYNITKSAQLESKLFRGVPRLYMGDATVDEGPLQRPELARPTTAVCKEILGLAATASDRNAPIGPWLYFHLGNLFFAKAHELDDEYEAHLDAAKGHYTSAKAELGKQPGHVLNDPEFNWLDDALERVETQRVWLKKLAAAKQARAAAEKQAAENDPVVRIETTRGVMLARLYLSESPALVNAVCALIDRGYYDGREVESKAERASFGSPFDGAGKSELGDGIRNRITQRTHVRGTISMELMGLESSLASTSRVLIMKADPSKGEQSFGGTSNDFDTRHSIVGQVTLGDERRAALVGSGDAKTRFAELLVIARHHGLDPAKLLRERILAKEKDAIAEQAETDAEEAGAGSAGVEERIKKATEAREKALEALDPWALSQEAVAKDALPTPETSNSAAVEWLADEILASEEDTLDGLGIGDRIVRITFVERGAYTGKLVNWGRIGEKVGK